MVRRFLALSTAMISIATIGSGGVAAMRSRPVHYQPRADIIPPSLADEPGQVVAAHCMACHSLDYITTQPRGKGAQFWREEVAKMVNVYKAPIGPDEAAEIAATLDRKFGG